MQLLVSRRHAITNVYEDPIAVPVEGLVYCPVTAGALLEGSIHGVAYCRSIRTRDYIDHSQRLTEINVASSRSTSDSR
jgi:hypothetical protein